MKNECIRLWSNDVQNMPELLCFLQLFHRVHGPLLINQYEEAIENYVNSNYKLTDSSWNRYGTNMDVKRLFEIGMFELSSSSHPMKVQPVQCILKANFHILRSGLISEIYKVLAILKKASIEEIVRRLKAYLSEDEFDQRNEIREAVMTASEVITIKDHYVTLNNDDAFFVVTDIF
ncbi:hypothetical protein DICVIV_12750 [Dictyocaulus viviparus]|uniref:Uncharacterized protein n=1 Tax=Dictyocaulus viviparus TaxID=29172 RepID=A0A0D8XFZ7_DICVI|nr:hypothetical protein DICVIV_12750 [Dictyocaulus viviparus]